MDSNFSQKVVNLRETDFTTEIFHVNGDNEIVLDSIRKKYWLDLIWVNTGIKLEDVYKQNSILFFEVFENEVPFGWAYFRPFPKDGVIQSRLLKSVFVY